MIVSSYNKISLICKSGNRRLFYFSHFSNNSKKIKNSKISLVRAHFGQSNFPFFQQKRKKEILLILVIFTYFKAQTKIEQRKWSEKLIIFSFSNFEARFKNTKKYCKRLKEIFCYFLFSCYCKKMRKMK